MYTALLLTFVILHAVPATDSKNYTITTPLHSANPTHGSRSDVDEAEREVVFCFQGQALPSALRGELGDIGRLLAETLQRQLEENHMQRVAPQTHTDPRLAQNSTRHCRSRRDSRCVRATRGARSECRNASTAVQASGTSDKCSETDSSTQQHWWLMVLIGSILIVLL